MRIHKLAGTDAFVVFDLDEAPRSVGVTRLAPKILTDGAALLARSTTYAFAAFEQAVGGASAGINTRPEGRADAVAAFVAEIRPLVETGAFVTDPGRGVTDADLAPLADAAPVPVPAPAERAALLGAGVVAAADRAAGGLAGRRVAVEGVDRAATGVLSELAARGAVVTAVSTGTATVADAAGLDVDVLVATLAEGGAAALTARGEGSDAEAQPAAAVFPAEADVLLVGSKAGVLDHDVAATVSAPVVVPWGPVPVTAKGFAVLRRRGCLVVPDFVAVAGPLLAAAGALPVAAGAGDGGDGHDRRAQVADLVTGVLDDVMGHADGPLLGACHRAEAYLRTWQASLPFGRPLA